MSLQSLHRTRQAIVPTKTRHMLPTYREEVIVPTLNNAFKLFSSSMEILYCILIIFLGLIFGSFGSVIFFRLGDLPTWKVLKGFLVGRSQCTHCHHSLESRDLIPIWSFFSQRGTCRYCKVKLSWRYPLLELGTVIIFLSMYALVGIEHLPFFILSCLGVWLLFLIFLYDYKEYELHLSASALFLILSLGGQIFL